MAIEIAALDAVVRTKGVDQSKRKLGGLNKQGAKAGRTFDKLKGAIAAAAGALTVAATARFLKGAIGEAIEAEKTWVGLRTAVENSGGSFEALAPHIQQVTDELQRTTRFAGDEGAAALKDLTISTGDAGQAMEALSVAADVAAATGLDLQKAAQFVGRTLNGETSILKRYGIVIGENEDAMTGLRRAVGGFAEQEAATLGGQLAQLKNAWDDFRREIGFALTETNDGVTIIGSMQTAIENMTGWVQTNARAIGAWVTVVRQSFGLAGQVVGLFGTTVMSVFRTVGELLGNLAGLIVGIFTFDIQLIRTSLAEAADTYVNGLQPVRDALRETAEEAERLIEAIALATAVGPTQARGNAARVAGGGRGAQGTTTFGGTLAGEDPEAVLTRFREGLDAAEMPDLTVGIDRMIADAIQSFEEGMGKLLAEQQRQAEAFAQASQQFGASIAQTLGDAIFNGVQAGLEGEGFSGLLKAFGNTLLVGLGQAITAFGQALISFGITTSGLAAGLSNPFTAGPAAIAIGAALVALGATFSSIVRGGVGRGTAQAGAFREPSFPTSPATTGTPDDVASRTVTLGTQTNPDTLTAASPVHLTIIGENDPRAQRQLVAMVRKAQRRGAR